MNKELEQIQISHLAKTGPLDPLRELKFLQNDLVSQVCMDATLNH